MVPTTKLFISEIQYRYTPVLYQRLFDLEELHKISKLKRILANEDIPKFGKSIILFLHVLPQLNECYFLPKNQAAPFLKSHSIYNRSYLGLELLDELENSN